MPSADGGCRYCGWRAVDIVAAKKWRISSCQCLGVPYVAEKRERRSGSSAYVGRCQRIGIDIEM